jgi:hypothetical protein
VVHGRCAVADQPQYVWPLGADSRQVDERNPAAPPGLLVSQEPEQDWLCQVRTTLLDVAARSVLS